MNGRSGRDEERNATVVMALAVLSSVFVLALMLALLAAVFALTNRAPSQPTDNGPYNTLARPVPQADRPSQLLPPALGDFRRESLSGNIENFRAVYQRGADRIDIRGSRAVSLPAAQANVKLAVGEIGQGNVVQHIIEADPRYSYALHVADDGVRFIWSRSIWFFEARASSKDALDGFMNNFRY